MKPQRLVEASLETGGYSAGVLYSGSDKDTFNSTTKGLTGANDSRKEPDRAEQRRTADSELANGFSAATENSMQT